MLCMSCCRRTSGSLLAGITLGICGTTGWKGFGFYFLTHLLVCLAAEILLECKC